MNIKNTNITITNEMNIKHNTHNISKKTDPIMIESMENRIDDLILWRSHSIGPRKFKKLIYHFGSASDALNYVQKKGSVRVLDSYFSSSMIYSRDLAKREIESVYDFGAEIISITSDEYQSSPYLSESLLTDLDYPCILTVKGDVSLLRKNALAVVGSRNASVVSKKWTENFCKELSDDFVIVSGLARGIDATAHEFSENTIAVLGHGVDKVYPIQNKCIYDEISQNGLLVSEFPFGSDPQAAYFSRRNLTIAAMSWGVVVVEASFKSGSLITANAALNQGKEVFAVPNHPLDLRSQGCNMLLKNGAFLVESASDFLSVYSQVANRSIFTQQKQKKSFIKFDGCNFDGVHLDKSHLDKLNFENKELNEENSKESDIKNTHTSNIDVKNSSTINTKKEIEDEDDNADKQSVSLNKSAYDMFGRSLPVSDILNCTSSTAISIQEICTFSGHSFEDVFESLLFLEMNDKVMRDIHGMIIRKF